MFFVESLKPAQQTLASGESANTMETEGDAAKAKNPLQLKPRKSMEIEDDNEDTYDKLSKTNNAQAPLGTHEESNGDDINLRTKILIITIFVVLFAMFIVAIIFRILYSSF